MTNEVISYLDMCQREGASLQRGMNFGLGRTHSVILMSVRPNAPYNDAIEDEGSTLIYEGHDVPRSGECPEPKRADQALETATGAATQNGRFYHAAQDYKNGDRPAERVRVYEKLRQGIWAYNGLFELVDAWPERHNGRRVFRFRLVAVEEDETSHRTSPLEPVRRRIIPTSVKLEVWRRDQGKCVICGSTNELHFDHILPYSKGGTSSEAENIQLLCVRHNLEKGSKIQ